jgi:glycosyltransferase involved in cell wall biosynthesis
MPCFNHAQFLRDSVGGILWQTYTDFELIIVDDGSSDNSWEIIQGFAGCDPRIRAFRHESNLGASKSRNDALRVAQGKFIGFCDADDIWEPDKLRVQVNLLQNQPEFDVVYCDTIIVDENGLPTEQRFSECFPPPKPASGWLFRKLIRRNFMNTQSVLMRNECLERVGHFDEDLKVLEDWWYWIRVSRNHRLLYSPEPLARYRVHSKNTNVGHNRAYPINRYKVYKRVLRKYADISRCAKASILYEMGVELYGLGKKRAGQLLLRNAIKVAIRDVRAIKTMGKALARMVIKVRTG